MPPELPRSIGDETQFFRGYWEVLRKLTIVFYSGFTGHIPPNADLLL
jgi:hypothetical protein